MPPARGLSPPRPDAQHSPPRPDAQHSPPPWNGTA